MAHRGGNGNKKHGRAKRTPATQRYKAEQRWVANKSRAIKRHTRHAAMKAIKRIKWAIRKGKATLQTEAARLQELRYVVSQNHTGQSA